MFDRSMGGLAPGKSNTRLGHAASGANVEQACRQTLHAIEEDGIENRVLEIESRTCSITVLPLFHGSQATPSCGPKLWFG